MLLRDQELFIWLPFLATHAQKGLPAFGIYGHEVLDADDTEMPEDVKEKMLRFGRAAVPQLQL